MKKLIIPVAMLSFLFGSCTKDKFECGAESNSPPADDSSILFIPTAFSPTNNALNDQYRVNTKNIETLHIEVYNTDNKLMYESDDINNVWLPDYVETGMTLLHYKITARSNKGYEYYRCGDLYSYKCLPKGFDANKLVFGDQYNPAYPGYFVPGVSAEVMESCK